MQTLLRTSVALCLLGCGGAAPAATDATTEPAPVASTDLASEEGITARAVELFAEHGGELGVEAVSPLTLRPTTPPHEELVITLDRVFAHCHRSEGECAEALEDYVQQTVSVLRSREADAVATAERLLPVLRPAAYGAMVAERTGVAGEEFAGGMVSLVVLDSEASAQPLTTETLSTLEMSEEQARAQALENLRQRFASANVSLDLPPQSSIGRLPTEDFYASSALLLMDLWAPLAARMERLLVAVPDPMVVLYVDGASTEARAALTTIASAMFGQSQRPLSSDVFEYGADGWTVVH